MRKCPRCGYVETKYCNTFGKMVYIKRKQKGLTGKELGKKCGIVWSYVSKIERTNTLPSMFIAHKISKCLKCPLLNQIWYKEKIKRLKGLTS